jgi:hypothetical protein
MSDEPAAIDAMMPLCSTSSSHLTKSQDGQLEKMHEKRRQEVQKELLYEDECMWYELCLTTEVRCLSIKGQSTLNARTTLNGEGTACMCRYLVVMVKKTQAHLLLLQVKLAQSCSTESCMVLVIVMPLPC